MERERERQRQKTYGERETEDIWRGRDMRGAIELNILLNLVSKL